MLIDWMIEGYFDTLGSILSEFFKVSLIGLVIGGLIISVILAKVVDK